MTALSKCLKFGLPALVTVGMAIPEISRVQKAMQKGNGTKQVFGSIFNVAKWSLIPAALAIASPAGVIACTALGIASFVLPSKIPELDFTA